MINVLYDFILPPIAMILLYIVIAFRDNILSMSYISFIDCIKLAWSYMTNTLLLMFPIANTSTGSAKSKTMWNFLDNTIDTELIYIKLDTLLHDFYLNGGDDVVFIGTIILTFSLTLSAIILLLQYMSTNSNNYDSLKVS